MTDRQERLARRNRLYGENDLSRLELFAGGYLNFGYWRDVRTDNPSTEDRIASQQAMYHRVVRELGTEDDDRLLEVGCGLGLGAALVANQYPVREISGVDVLPVQIDRAKNVNASAIAAMPGRLHYIVGSASDLPLIDRSVHKVFSIEAAQHFEDMPGFAAECYRVLTHAGRIALATFFSSDRDDADPLAQRLETFAEGIDLATPVDAVVDALGGAGFTEVGVRSIGDDVWHGFDRWLAHTSYAEAWPREWLRAHQDGLLDYYLITARKP
ncbi:class I SAM-dependent methyltransferase [Parasphingorhabdus pacifica]